MKIPVVKKLAETHSVSELRAAEKAIEEGKTPAIPIEGDDEGEQLTHAYAAAWVREKMDSEGLDARQAMREYTKKVRNSIS